MEGSPDDIEALRAALAAAQARALVAEAKVSDADTLIAHQKLLIEKLRRELYGWRSERRKLLLDQMELVLEDLEASATEDELDAERAAAGTANVQAFTRKKPSKKPFPEHLPRERVVILGPTSCSCCGSTKLAKLGETITETLEVIPRQWKVLQYVREKLTCRPKAGFWGRDDLAATGSFPCDPTRFCRHEPVGPWLALAADQPERKSCSRNMASISRSIARASAMPVKASTYLCRRLPIWLVRAPSRFGRWCN